MGGCVLSCEFTAELSRAVSHPRFYAAMAAQKVGASSSLYCFLHSGFP